MTRRRGGRDSRRRRRRRKARPSAALGIVSRAGAGWRSLRGGDAWVRGSSSTSRCARRPKGGVVVDAGGRAIRHGGVRAAQARPRDSRGNDQARRVTQLERDGRIARGYLGLGLQPVRLEGGGEGAMVMSVDATGPGAAAGVRQGDIIVGWNGQPLRTVAIVRGSGPGSVDAVVRVSATRRRACPRFSVTIGARPDSLTDDRRPTRSRSPVAIGDLVLSERIVALLGDSRRRAARRTARARGCDARLAGEPARLGGATIHRTTRSPMTKRSWRRARFASRRATRSARVARRRRVQQDHCTAAPGFRSTPPSFTSARCSTSS